MSHMPFGERPELNLVSHGRKVALIGRPVPVIKGLIVTTGLSPLIECSVVTGDLGLISAFVERWHRETNTFHLPVGELMITLDDVSPLLHLPISGAFHNFEALSVDEAIFLLMELLEVSGEEARAETSATNVHVVHLEAFRDLGQSGGYAWGAAILCWTYKHFPSVHQCVTDDAYEETSPRASRWLTMKAHMKGITGALYRACCDALTVTDVCWLPYSDHRGVKGFEPISSFQGQLRWGPTVVTVRPERVLRQFGWMHFLNHVVAVDDLCVVPGQVGDQPRHAPAPDHEDYMQPNTPQVPVAFDPPRHAVDDYEGYEAIAERLERVLNLRMVTTGTELHDIMQDFLRIARGVLA
ncbi:protein MAIN-LIKE 2-like [Glycine max]|uniref:protein MAIN-LIKE 2-like n=1 Tax=Glycine max TaxID=3847 RepID=UPI0003DEC99E|nr:protein MAIN-LIKE 2-like [Glycine max]|eukprot:XP_006574266.1 protein MAIN-LIKE 2-like [Glycine max]